MAWHTTFRGENTLHELNYTQKKKTQRKIFEPKGSEVMCDYDAA
jgi:hypothetical protein